jgi:hypothetical protein
VTWCTMISDWLVSYDCRLRLQTSEDAVSWLIGTASNGLKFLQFGAVNVARVPPQRYCDCSSGRFRAIKNHFQVKMRKTHLTRWSSKTLGRQVAFEILVASEPIFFTRIKSFVNSFVRITGFIHLFFLLFYSLSTSATTI